MSILDEIEGHRQRGTLIKFEAIGDPRAHRTRELVQRTLYISEPLQSFLESTRSLAATAQAELSDFVSGKQITVSLSLNHEDCFMARLQDPAEEVWEIRIYDDSEQVHLRFFGRFAERDIFVALTKAEKSWFRRRKVDHKRMKQTCKDEWARLFKHGPLSKGDDLNAYLSSNFDSA
jgi:hypothetical protein